MRDDARAWVQRFFENDPGASIDDCARSAKDERYPVHKDEIGTVRREVRQRLDWRPPPPAEPEPKPDPKKKEKPVQHLASVPASPAPSPAAARPPIIRRPTPPPAPALGNLGEKLRAAGVAEPVEVKDGRPVFSNRRKVEWVNEDGTTASEVLQGKNEVGPFVERLVIDQGVDPVDIKVLKEVFEPKWTEAKIKVHVQIDEE